MWEPKTCLMTTCLNTHISAHTISLFYFSLVNYTRESGAKFTKTYATFFLLERISVNPDGRNIISEGRQRMAKRTYERKA